MSSTAAVKRKNMKHYSVGSIIWIIVEYASLIFFGFCAIIPIVSCITTAFKTDAEYQNTNVMAFPGSWLNFDNFVNAFKTANMGRAFLNSVIVMVVVLTVSVIVGSQLAYVLNRFKFPGNGFIRNLYTIAALLPAVAMQVTVYQIMSDLHLVNSLGGYIIMSCGTDVISMYIFIQFMENIPLSLDESAIIDGANYWQIYWKIMLPLLNRQSLHPVFKGCWCVQRILRSKPLPDEKRDPYHGTFPLHIRRTNGKQVQSDLCRCYYLPASGADRICLLPETDLQWHYSRCGKGLMILENKRYRDE